MPSKEKQLVHDFYTSGFHKDTSILKEYLHKDVTIYWNSSSGFSKLDYEDFARMSSDIGKSYEGLSCEITHLLQEDNKVTIRFTYNANTIENPEEDIALRLLDGVFGVPDIFGSNQATETDFHTALHQLFQFYSIGLLVIAFLILAYYIFVVLAEFLSRTINSNPVIRE